MWKGGLVTPQFQIGKVSDISLRCLFFSLTETVLSHENRFQLFISKMVKYLIIAMYKIKIGVLINNKIWINYPWTIKVESVVYLSKLKAQQ